MNITREIAALVAKGLTENSEAWKRAEKQQLEVIELVKQRIEREIPKRVFEFNSEHPGYLITRNEVYVKDSSRNWARYVKTSPYLYPSRHGEVLKIVDEVISKAADSAHNATESCKKVERDLEELVYKQRTVARLLKVMPQAEAYLPQQEQVSYNLPATSVQDLLKKLN